MFIHDHDTGGKRRKLYTMRLIAFGVNAYNKNSKEDVKESLSPVGRSICLYFRIETRITCDYGESPSFNIRQNQCSFAYFIRMNHFPDRTYLKHVFMFREHHSADNIRRFSKLCSGALHTMIPTKWYLIAFLRCKTEYT